MQVLRHCSATYAYPGKTGRLATSVPDWVAGAIEYCLGELVEAMCMECTDNNIMVLLIQIPIWISCPIYVMHEDSLPPVCTTPYCSRSMTKYMIRAVNPPPFIIHDEEAGGNRFYRCQKTGSRKTKSPIYCVGGMIRSEQCSI